MGHIIEVDQTLKTWVIWDEFNLVSKLLFSSTYNDGTKKMGFMLWGPK